MSGIEYFKWDHRLYSNNYSKHVFVHYYCSMHALYNKMYKITYSAWKIEIYVAHTVWEIMICVLCAQVLKRRPSCLVL